jgi:hypothetical protein
MTIRVGRMLIIGDRFLVIIGARFLVIVGFSCIVTLSLRPTMVPTHAGCFLIFFDTGHHPIFGQDA